MLVVEVREDDGDVGYLLVPSAWTEELHGELSTAARPAELREPEGKIGERERGGGAREERRGRARVWRRRGGLVVPGGQVEEGPRRWCPRHCLSAWSRGNEDDGGTQR